MNHHVLYLRERGERQRSGVWGFVTELWNWLHVTLSQLRLGVTVTHAQVPDVEGRTCTSEVSRKEQR